MAALVKTIDAPAKINLFLEVLDRRRDGYHNVCLVSQAVDLIDRIGIAESDTGADTIEASGFFAAAVPPNPERNTIGRVLARLRRDWPEIPPLRVEVEKNIPAGAGLGGGSADAAAAAMEVRRRYLPEVPAEDVVQALADVGSDMPFAAQGGTALVEGRGERLTPVPFRFDEAAYLLVSPPLEVSTVWAYAALAEVGDRPRRSPETLRAALSEGDYDAFAGGVWNAFESVVFAEHPQLAELVAMMEWAGCDAAWMTGSGSNFVGLCRDESRAAAAAQCLGEKTDYPVRVVRPYSKRDLGPGREGEAEWR
jgi:4-diphosphocytidyl-2-C-methyl-D-erythritol kinase